MNGTAHAAPTGPAATRARAAEWVSTAGLPLLAALLFTNASDVSVRAFHTPSLLQPLVAVLGLAACVLHRELRVERTLQPLTFALAAWCAIVVVSTIWARDLSAADERAVETAKGLILFLVITALASSWRALRLAILTVVASAAFLSLLTLAQSAAGESSQEFFGLARVQSSTLYGEEIDRRASGPVGDPNFYAQMLLVALALALFSAAAQQRRALRLACYGAAGVIFGAVLLTYSRGGMLALLVMAAVSIRHLRIERRHVAIGAALVALMALTQFILPLEVARRLRTVESLLSQSSIEHDSSILKRRLLLSASWRMFEDHPLFGVGAGNFARHFNHYRDEVGFAGRLYEERGARHFPHNFYMEVAAENGLVGLALFSTAAAIAVITVRRCSLEPARAVRRGNAWLATAVFIALVGYLASSLFLHGAFQRYLWMTFAFAAAVIRLTGEDRLLAAAPQEGP